MNNKVEKGKEEEEREGEEEKKGEEKEGEEHGKVKEEEEANKKRAIFLKTNAVLTDEWAGTASEKWVEKERKKYIGPKIGGSYAG